MVSSDQVLAVDDPLAGYSSFFLFPHSLSSPFHPNRNPNSNGSPLLESIHSHLKATVLRSPEKFLKQAKTILGDSSAPLSTGKASAMASEDMKEAVPAANKKIPQEKRPALGLKRAKFSAKPIPSQPAAMSVPSIDVDKHPDPEEFFATYERIENAKKEMERAGGEPLVQLDQNLSHLPPRRRRPSLLGKSVTYKHHSYSSTETDASESFLSSQEKNEHRTLTPINDDVLSQTNAVNVLPNAKLSDSTSTITRNDEKLDELISSDDGLDEPGVLNLLKLDFNLKDCGKPSLPSLRDVRPRKSETSCVALPKMNGLISRQVQINNSVGGKSLLCDTLLKEGSTGLHAYPSQSKSPLASISSLTRQLSRICPSNDPFSALDTQSKQARSSLEMQQGKQSHMGDVGKDLYNSLRSHEHGEEQTPVASPVSAANDEAPNEQPKERQDGVGQTDQVSTAENLHEFGRIAAHGEESNTACGRDSHISAVKDIAPLSEPKEGVNEVSGSDLVETREHLHDLGQSPACRDERVADPFVEDEAARVWDSVRQELNFEGSNLDKSTFNEVEGCGIAEASNMEDVSTEEQIKETVGSSNKRLEEGKQSEPPSQANIVKKTVKKGRKADTLSNAPVSKETGNKRRKVEGDLAGPRKRREQHRQSLVEAAGTKWESGLRRSTRIRMRPLEYWKGERFLYGRVHNSLVTVIGVKYASPTKEAEQRAVKVKAFVPDEYKDLVDLAASH